MNNLMNIARKAMAVVAFLLTSSLKKYVFYN